MTGRPARDAWAELRTRVHVAWLERRDRTVRTFGWIVPLALLCPPSALSAA